MSLKLAIEVFKPPATANEGPVIFIEGGVASRKNEKLEAKVKPVATLAFVKLRHATE